MATHGVEQRRLRRRRHRRATRERQCSVRLLHITHRKTHPSNERHVMNAPREVA